MRVIYKEIDGCDDCLYNKQGMCYDLSRPLSEIVFERDCSLPSKQIVESFTRYITKSNKSIKACGNCKHWDRWSYNKNIKTEIGTCNKDEILLFCHCNSDACKDFKEV